MHPALSLRFSVATSAPAAAAPHSRRPPAATHDISPDGGRCIEDPFKDPTLVNSALLQDLCSGCRTRIFSQRYAAHSLNGTVLPPPDSMHTAFPSPIACLPHVCRPRCYGHRLHRVDTELSPQRVCDACEEVR